MLIQFWLNSHYVRGLQRSIRQNTIPKAIVITSEYQNGKRRKQPISLGTRDVQSIWLSRINKDNAASAIHVNQAWWWLMKLIYSQENAVHFGLPNSFLHYPQGKWVFGAPTKKRHKCKADLKSKALVDKAGIVLSLLWKWVWDKKRGCIAVCAMQPLVGYE